MYQALNVFGWLGISPESLVVMTINLPLRVAILIDLSRSPYAGGHVKYWERIASAAVGSSLPLDLTLYFSGSPATETLSSKVRMRQLRPVFSTALLKFLPYVPDHTDLSPYHPQLARELVTYDVIHTTDGFFAFAGTAERVTKRKKVPLVSSVHTDTPAYARVFTRNTIEEIFGGGWLGDKMLSTWRLHERQGQAKKRRLQRHLRTCHDVFVTRREDRVLAEGLLERGRVQHLRLGVDRAIFGPNCRDRDGIEHDYAIPKDSVIALFVGRVDIGKNIDTLIEAVSDVLQKGVPLHLIVAGRGPAMAKIKERLGSHTSILGFVKPQELARLYASVDLLAIPSEIEIGSMVCVEALASGCPVLVSQKSNIASIFDNTPAIYVVDGDSKSWASALCELAEAPRQLEQMSMMAAVFSQHEIASWQDVLEVDLFPVWTKVANHDC